MTPFRIARKNTYWAASLKKSPPGTCALASIFRTKLRLPAPPRMRVALPAAAPFSGRRAPSLSGPAPAAARDLPGRRERKAGRGKTNSLKAMGLFGKTQEKPPKELVRAAAKEWVDVRGAQWSW